jgi:hypothetical protein
VFQKAVSTQDVTNPVSLSDRVLRNGYDAVIRCGTPDTSLWRSIGMISRYDALLQWASWYLVITLYTGLPMSDYDAVLGMVPPIPLYDLVSIWVSWCLVTTQYYGMCSPWVLRVLLSCIIFLSYQLQIPAVYLQRLLHVNVLICLDDEVFVLPVTKPINVKY